MTSIERLEDEIDMAVQLANAYLTLSGWCAISQHLYTHTLKAQEYLEEVKEDFKARRGL